MIRMKRNETIKLITGIAALVLLISQTFLMDKTFEKSYLFY